MSVNAAQIGPGDIIVTLEGKAPFSHLIRFGAWLRRQSPKVDHVIGVHHYGPPAGQPDGRPRWWGIEGRPGGVGWRDLTKVLARKNSWSNAGQIAAESHRWQPSGWIPATEQETRFLLATYFERLLKIPYDWEAIGAHARVALRAHHIRKLREWREGEFPAEVVCSSGMDAAMEEVHLTNPGGNAVTRLTSPAQFLTFFLDAPWTRL